MTPPAWRPGSVSFGTEPENSVTCPAAVIRPALAREWKDRWRPKKYSVQANQAPPPGAAATVSTLHLVGKLSAMPTGLPATAAGAPARRASARAAGRRCLVSLIRGRGSGRVGALFAHFLAGDEVLGEQQVVAGALDHVQEVAHQRDLLDLLLDEPLQELLGAVVLQFAGELEEGEDLVADPFLLGEGHFHRLGAVGVGGRVRLDVGDLDLLADIEQVADHHHRVLALLERLPVEEGGEAGQRFRVVVDGRRDVLLGGGELVRDLLVEGGGEGLLGHRVAPYVLSLVARWLRRLAETTSSNVAERRSSVSLHKDSASLTDLQGKSQVAQRKPSTSIRGSSGLEGSPAAVACFGSL